MHIARDHDIVYVDPTGVQHIAHTADPHVLIKRVNRHLTVFKPVVLPGGKTKTKVISLNDALVLRDLERLLNRMDMGPPILITNTPLADRIASDFPWHHVVYDIIDDYIQTSWAPADAPERERRLLRRADCVFCGTYSLFEKKRGIRPDIEYIPCGVETGHFMKATDPETPVPDDIARLPKPIAGYFGAVNERIDADLLVYLAESLPDVSIVLIGPVFADFKLSDFDTRWASVLPGPDSPGFRLKHKPDNLHFLGLRSYDVLPNYLKAFDVCLLPYVLNDVTRDIHPVKVLEYLAPGKPVVATPIPDIVRFYDGIVAIAGSPREFAEKTERLLKFDLPGDRRKRMDFAQPKTWENMAERMLDRIYALEIPGWDPARKSAQGQSVPHQRSRDSS